MPCDTSLLLLPGEISEKCKKILLAADHDSLKACKEAISSDIQHVGHLSRGVAGAVADLGKEKERRAKEHNREVEKEKRKQQLLKDKENKKAKMHAERWTCCGGWPTTSTFETRGSYTRSPRGSARTSPQ